LFPPGTLDHWTGTRLNLDQQQEIATNNKSIDLNVLVGEGWWTMSLTTKKSSLESSTQLIDHWMEQNLGVQENRNAGGMPGKNYWQAIYQCRLGLGTGYRSNIDKQSISAD
jgi:hypothetical protein